MNQQVIDNLIKTIETDPDYIRYLDLQNQLREHQDINILIKKIKALQKQATKEEHQGKCIKEVEQTIKEKTNQLNNIPLYIEYSNALEQVNETFNLINEKINNYIEEQVNF